MKANGQIRPHDLCQRHLTTSKLQGLRTSTIDIYTSKCATSHTSIVAPSGTAQTSLTAPSKSRANPIPGAPSKSITKTCPIFQTCPQARFNTTASRHIAIRTGLAFLNKPAQRVTLRSWISSPKIHRIVFPSKVTSKKIFSNTPSLLVCQGLSVGQSHEISV
jgi:hypothetical protein